MNSPIPIDRDVRQLRDALLQCHRDVSESQTDHHTRNLLKRIGAGRVQLAEHLVEILHDAMERGAPRVDVERPLRVMLAIVAAWYGDAPVSAADLRKLMLLETQAQGAADVASLELSLDPTPKAVADAAEHIDRHREALENLSHALHRRSVA